MSPGKGTICPVNDECGANNLNDLKNANTNLNSSVDHDFKRRCLYIGEGVLSKIIVTSSKLYANIAGETTEEGEDLVVLDFPPVDLGEKTSNDHIGHIKPAYGDRSSGNI